ncbi:hypothetical protein [Paenibacillus sp. UNC451MF]|uniref:hypothetical protein n=1 Tax=Paenibacillus sp. UNC451MF TaxID=1449063 RepID=UPI0012DF6F46|nr:hypothetical protein [Paenibacillus sp. UNC451MF]
MEQVLKLSHAFYAGIQGSFSLVDNIMGNRMIAKYVISDLETGLIYGYALLAEQIMQKIKLRLEFVVKNDFTLMEVIHELYNKIENVIKKVAPYTVETRMFTPNSKEINFFTGKGFKENHRMVKQILHIQSANIDSITGLENDLQNKGIIISTLAEEKVYRSESLNDLKRLILDTNPDFPNELPSHLMQPNKDTSWLNKSELIPEAFFIAIQEGCYVGYSCLFKGPNNSLIQGNTAICRDLRNLGIATLLKLRGISFAKMNSFDIIYTANRDSNRSMARINEKLGWIMYDSEIRMEKIVNKQYGI